MKVTLSTYIPVVMATFTIGTFLFFLLEDFSSTGNNRKHFVRRSADNARKEVHRADVRDAVETRYQTQYSGIAGNLTRASKTAGILWPKLLDITPKYSGESPRLSQSAAEALVFAASSAADNNNDVASQYPAYVSLLSVISNWNPDDPDVPNTFIETIQHFNYCDPVERAMARRYRDAEIPFKLHSVPEVNEVSKKWTNEYLTQKLAKHGHMVEVSKHNHFMFWKDKATSKAFPSWKPPTEHINMDFPTWLKIAQNADKVKLKNDTTHHYFITNAATGDRKTFVAKDLNFFATDTENFFITNVPANKGIQCRFGMRGIIAETHYDGGKNMIAMIKGKKRYILDPPSTCKYLGFEFWRFCNI
jgi:hypothetical protein